ncbi:MAG: DHH family phosphoesterase [Oscillospiraceae bacterium]|nr:DHH family phosphoesterase [Oscillospiraceae bacterium]
MPQWIIVFAVMLAMTAALFFVHGLYAGLAALVLTIAAAGLTFSLWKKQQEQVQKQIESITMDINTVSALATSDSPVALAVVQTATGGILWGNDCFADLTKRYSSISDLNITDIFESVDVSSLHQLLEKGGSILASYEGREFKIALQRARAQKFRGLCTLSFTDVTEEEASIRDLEHKRPVVALLQIDNYDELVANLSGYDRTFLLANIESKINSWADKSTAIMVRGDRNRYTLLFEEGYLDAYRAERFELLDAVREIKNPEGMSATLSMGLGCQGRTYNENVVNARLALDMALSRGGDQAVVKNTGNYEFFGGSSREVEKRTKVRARIVANTVSDLVKSSPNVIIMGHRYSDMDSLGSSVGVACICRKLGVPWKIVYDERTTSAKVLHDNIAQASEYASGFVSGEKALELMTDDTLLVVVDVNNADFTDAPAVVERAKKIVVIDHHRRTQKYIEKSVINLHEPYASSASELVSELLQYITTTQDILRAEAECMLAGIMLDTKNFTVKTGVRTFESAAFLRRAGADTIEVKMLFKNDMDDYMDRCDIIKTAQRYQSGIAIAYTEKNVKREIAAQAADELMNIEGVEGSFVVFRYNDGTQVSGRSLGKINVQVILEKLGGGGSMMEAGAQPGDKSVMDVIEALKNAIDVYYSTK